MKRWGGAIKPKLKPAKQAKTAKADKQVKHLNLPN